jgi:dihydroorotase
MRTLPLLALAAAAPLAAQPAFDLLLKGGHVLDPAGGRNGILDVAVTGGKIAAVETSIDPARAAMVVDVKGLYVTPGLVDIHTHLFHTTGVRDAWAGDNSIQPDVLSFRSCVTTMVDAGSSGWRNFETFRHTVIDRARTRVLALINIAGLGMMADVTEQVRSDFQPAELARLARKHSDVVVGVKTAHYQLPDWASVDAALEAGKLAGLPVMVDFGYFLPERPYWRLVTEKLRPGDISTHMFRGPVPYVDDNGRLYDYLRRARSRGVKFDVGHGNQSFVLRNAAPAMEQGFAPDTISTDLHAQSMNAQAQDLPTVMSKFLALGMPLPGVVLRTTVNAAQVIRRPGLGTLAAGADADIAVLRLDKGSYGFGDAYGGRIEAGQRLFCDMTLRSGQIVWDQNARAGTDWRRLKKDYGIRPGIDRMIRPE